MYIYTCIHIYIYTYIHIYCEAASLQQQPPPANTVCCFPTNGSIRTAAHRWRWTNSCGQGANGKQPPWHVWPWENKDCQDGSWGPTVKLTRTINCGSFTYIYIYAPTNLVYSSTIKFIQTIQVALECGANPMLICYPWVPSEICGGWRCIQAAWAMDWRHLRWRVLLPGQFTQEYQF